MKISTTITAMKDNICLFETDAIAHVEYDFDEFGGISWFVDQWTVEERQAVWNDARGIWEQHTKVAAVPEALAKVFDSYMDKEWLEEQLIERLLDAGVIDTGETSASMRGDYQARVI
jgi:hypothetical protein